MQTLGKWHMNISKSSTVVYRGIQQWEMVAKVTRAVTDSNNYPPPPLSLHS